MAVCTRGGQPVLIGWLVVVQGQEHHIHGEDKHTGQKDVEDQIEEQDQTWNDTEEQSFTLTV